MKTIQQVLLVVLALRVAVCHGTEDLFVHRESINLAKAAGTSRLLLVGDDHTQPAIKRFLADNLLILRRDGFSCLAIEMLPQSFQEDLNAWTPKNRDRVRRHLAAVWGDKGPEVADALYDLIAKAKESGFHVVALDPPDASAGDRATVNPLWAACIKTCLLQNPGMRMIVFSGRSHLDPLSTAFPTLSISIMEFAGLDSWETAEMDFKTARLLGRPAHPTTLLTLESYRTASRRNCMVAFGVPSHASTWIIHLAEPIPTSLALR